jgi:hypothetical protein
MYIEVVLDTGLAAIPVDQIQIVRASGLTGSIIRAGGQDYTALHTIEDVKGKILAALNSRVAQMTTQFVNTSDEIGRSRP